MDTGKTIFPQLMDFLPVYEFQKCVQRYNGHYKVKHFSCWSQFLCMAFAQLTYRESLRDIEACLRSTQRKLYHMGFRGNVSLIVAQRAQVNNFKYRNPRPPQPVSNGRRRGNLLKINHSSQRIIPPYLSHLFNHLPTSIQHHRKRLDIAHGFKPPP